MEPKLKNNWAIEAVSEKFGHGLTEKELTGLIGSYIIDETNFTPRKNVRLIDVVEHDYQVIVQLCHYISNEIYHLTGYKLNLIDETILGTLLIDIVLCE